MYPMTQFVVNLLSESGNRYLKVALDLELSDIKLQPEMDHKKSLIRDIIIRTFSSKTFEEISTLKGKDKLKDEVLDKINENLSDGQVKNIYFTDFVVQ
jgi:flagellar FliL protein